MDLNAETANAAGNGAATHSGPQTANSNAAHSHELLHALLAMRTGDFSVRMSGDQLGLEGKIAEAWNNFDFATMNAQLSATGTRTATSSPPSNGAHSCCRPA